MELKDKVTKGEGSSSDALFVSDRNNVVDEAVSALLMLGFSKPNISKAIKQIMSEHPNVRVEELIKLALQIL